MFHYSKLVSEKLWIEEVNSGKVDVFIFPAKMFCKSLQAAGLQNVTVTENNSEKYSFLYKVEQKMQRFSLQ